MKKLGLSHEAIREREPKLAPMLAGALRRRWHGKGGARGCHWHVDESYLKVGGRWCYLCSPRELLSIGVQSRPLPSKQNIEFNKDKFFEELEYLRLILLLHKLLEINKLSNKSIDSYSLGNILGKAYVLSSEDLGIEKEAVKRRGEAFSKRLGEYGRYLESIDEKMLNSRGVYFYLIVYFSELVTAGKGNMNGRGTVPQSFDIFGYAKQVYRNDEKVLIKMLKKVEILD